MLKHPILLIFIHEYSFISKISFQEESSNRKNQMKALDLDRRQNEKLNDLESEAKENAEHLLTRANEMRQEQEDEIKHLNEVSSLVNNE